MAKKKGSLRSVAGGEPAGAIQCRAVLLRPKAGRTAADWTFLRLTPRASGQLPSRGLNAVRGTINGVPFEGVLQPDGEGGHWFRVEQDLREKAGAEAGDEVELVLASLGDDAEPTIPEDLKKGLAGATEKAREVWKDITPAARRDFVHWVVSPKQAQTRARRIAAACDMLDKGKRRPCCFDRSGMYSGSLSCPVADDSAAAPARARRRTRDAGG